ncbi:MAG: hypothetical protein J1G06_05120, partial [Oscillospiraceae bacterium]|nr:hypothetical protein [Oscillospiraceae bacterium]
EGDDRIVTVAQGTATTTATVAAGETASIELAVTAGTPVYIYCLEGGAINLYGIKLISNGEDPIEPPADKCVKITVAYNADGSLADVKAEEALKSEATAAVRTESSLVTYWESLTSMKPVVAE